MLRSRTLLFLLAFALLSAACEADDTTTPAEDVTVPEDLGGVDVAPDVPEAPPLLVSMPREGATHDEALRPLYPHLTWQHDPSTTVTVQWRVPSEGLEGYAAKVWFAREDELQVEGDVVTMPYDEAHVVEIEPTLYEFANIFEFFYFPEVELTGLVPNTRYVYRAGTWEDVNAENGRLLAPTTTPLHHFRTGLPKGARDGFTYVAAGDSRGGYDRIAEEAPRLRDIDAAFWIFSGDMTTTGMPREWDTWFEAMGPIMRDTVLMAVAGNHEIMIDLFYALFALPRTELVPEANPELGWSFVYGNALFLGLDSRMVTTVDDQVDFVRHVLEEHKDDPDIDWRIVNYHHSAYSSSNHEDTERVQTTWVPIFEEYGVDLALAGHDHNYERTIPILANEPAPEGEGMVHVVAGGFFAPGYSPGTNWYTCVSHHGDKNNYVVIEVGADELTLTAYDGRGVEELDHFVLQK